MSKHRKHRKRDYTDLDMKNSNNNNNNNDNSGSVNSNLNMDSIMKLLNEMDSEKLSNMLANLNESLNQKETDSSNAAEGSDINKNSNNDFTANDNSIKYRNNDDKTLQLLNAIKPLFPPDRVFIIEKIIQLYSMGESLNTQQ